MKRNKPLYTLWQQAQPYRPTLYWAITCSILNKICDITPEILIGLAIDIIVRQQASITAGITGISNPFHQLCLVSSLTALFWIFESVFEYCYLIAWRTLAQTIQHNLRLTIYNHVQQLDMSYLETKTTGGLLSIVINDVDELERFLSTGPNAFIQLGVNIIAMGAIFAVISPQLALLTLLPVPCVILTAYFFQHKLATLYSQVREQYETLSAHVAGRLMGIATIKSYVAEAYELKALSTESFDYQRVHITAATLNAAYIPLVRMAILAGFTMSLMVGGWYALNGNIALSAYSVLVFLTQRFLWPFTELASMTDTYEQAMASMRRINTALSQRPTIQAGNIKGRQKIADKDLVLTQVSFSYPNKTQALRNLTVTIPAKKTVAFVGSTGSGKSTLTKLLLRFYQPQSGSILWGDIKIQDFDIKALRRSIGLVSQEVYLLHGTVAQNIAYGLPDATQHEIMAAAQMAEAHNFIMQLPQGYETIIQEGGKNLSGGQRQRISIARALLKKPALFIFDEATSALDNETEAAIQRSLAALAHHHTMVIIAHRLSTIRHADIIYVMKDGEIVESGNHEALLAYNSIYAGLWKLQTGA